MHRFTADGVAVSVAAEEYAQLNLAMRTVATRFDALFARGQIRVHATDDGCVPALADAAIDALIAGTATVMAADTNEQVAAIRNRLVATGQVDDEHTNTTNAGQRIRVGDRNTTRRNNAEMGVANRDTWTVRRVDSDGGLTVSGEHRERTLAAGYVREHVELAYASTAHGVQGDTATSAHA